MSVEKNVPEIRFKGFNGEWVEKPLNHEVELFSGLTYSPKDIRKEGVFVIRSSNVKNGQIVQADNVYVNPEVVNCSNVQKGDIIVVVRNGSRSLIGKHAQVHSLMNDTVIGAFMTGIRAGHPEFINALFDTAKFTAQVEKNLGATINQITNGAFNSMVFMFPEEQEKNAIGTTFQKLDNLINQHQQKHDKLNNIKKAMQEKMFPKPGKTIPEIRFKGFSGEWSYASLSKIADKFDNLRIPVTAKDRISGSTPYFGANGIQGYVEGYTHEGEYVLLAEDGANDLKNYPIHYVNGKVWVNNHAHVLKAKERYSNLFLKYALVSIDFEPFLVGGGRAKLNASVMMDLDITFTENIEEQTAIGNYFQKLDALINQHQQQITKLNNIKQACLSKMFV